MTPPFSGACPTPWIVAVVWVGLAGRAVNSMAAFLHLQEAPKVGKKQRKPKNNFRKTSTATPQTSETILGVGGVVWGPWGKLSGLGATPPFCTTPCVTGALLQRKQKPLPEVWGQSRSSQENSLCIAHLRHTGWYGCLRIGATLRRLMAGLRVGTR